MISRYCVLLELPTRRRIETLFPLPGIPGSLALIHIRSIQARHRPCIFRTAYSFYWAAVISILDCPGMSLEILPKLLDLLKFPSHHESL